MSKPVIGVMPLWDQERESMWMLPGYFDGIIQAGGIPLMLPLTDETAVCEQMLEHCDGFLFTGGQDLLPELYGQRMTDRCGETCTMRDRMEQQYFNGAVLKRDKPVLGICRGIQLFNAMLGGTLYQDIPAEHSTSTVTHQQQPPYHRPVHKVTIIKDSPLHQWLACQEIQVNSYHHQGIKQLADDLAPMAAAADGIIEAVYMPGRRFAAAVQWHPEFSLNDHSSQTLFSKFVAACKGEIV